jgi:hypothetical protein
MPAANEFDPRREKLVYETRTLWSPELGVLSDDDKKWLAAAVHDSPQDAARLVYERTHTGFIREITITVADVERLYRERAAHA